MTVLRSADIYRNPEASKIANSIGMMVLLVSFSMLFAALLLGYTVYRFKSDQWPPMGMEPVPLFYPVLSTVLIVISSLTYSLFESFHKRGQSGAAKGCLMLTFLLGVGFMVSQFALWDYMKGIGYVAETGIFASLIYSFTWIHAGHIVAGLLALLFIMFFVFKGAAQGSMAINVGKFWHFLDIVWVIIFVALFIV